MGFILIQGVNIIFISVFPIPRFSLLDDSPGPGRTDFQSSILQRTRLDVPVSILDPAKLCRKKNTPKSSTKHGDLKSPGFKKVEYIHLQMVDVFIVMLLS